MKKIKIFVEKRPDGYVAYPLGLKGVVVGEGDSYEAAWRTCSQPSDFTSTLSARRSLSDA